MPPPTVPWDGSASTVYVPVLVLLVGDHDPPAFPDCLAVRGVSITRNLVARVNDHHGLRKVTGATWWGDPQPTADDEWVTQVTRATTVKVALLKMVLFSFSG